MKQLPLPDINHSLLEMVGNTPLLEIKNIDVGLCRLFVKMESQNPGGSIKDRVAMSIIEQAERDGLLKDGGTIVEATAGNTGLGLALIGVLKGYRVILVIPDKMSQEKILHLKALGTEIIFTRSDVSIEHPEYYHNIAERIVKETSEILNNAGYLFIEHGYDQSDLVVSIFERCGFSQIRTFKDLNGDDRVCLGKLNRC